MCAFFGTRLNYMARTGFREPASVFLSQILVCGMLVSLSRYEAPENGFEHGKL